MLAHLLCWNPNHTLFNETRTSNLFMRRRCVLLGKALLATFGIASAAFAEEQAPSSLIRGSPINFIYATKERDLQMNKRVCNVWSADFDNTIGSYGNMFNVRAKSSSITITGLEFYTDLNYENGEVAYILYTKNGTFQDATESLSDWRRVASGFVSGNGNGKLTPIPKELNLAIDQGSSRAFYITLTSPDLRYNYGVGDQPDALSYEENDHIEIREGLATLSWPLSTDSLAGPRQFVGAVHYKDSQSCTNIFDQPQESDRTTTLVEYKFSVQHFNRISRSEFIDRCNSAVGDYILDVMGKGQLGNFVRDSSVQLDDVSSYYLRSADNAPTCIAVDTINICSLVSTFLKVSHINTIRSIDVRKIFSEYTEDVSDNLPFTSTSIGPRSFEGVSQFEVQLEGVSRTMRDDEKICFQKFMEEYIMTKLTEYLITSIMVEVVDQSFRPRSRKLLVSSSALRGRRFEEIEFNDVKFEIQGEFLPPIDNIEKLLEESIFEDGYGLWLLFQNGNNVCKYFREVTTLRGIDVVFPVDNLEPIYNNTTDGKEGKSDEGKLLLPLIAGVACGLVALIVTVCIFLCNRKTKQGYCQQRIKAPQVRTVVDWMKRKWSGSRETKRTVSSATKEGKRHQTSSKNCKRQDVSGFHTLGSTQIDKSTVKRKDGYNSHNLDGTQEMDKSTSNHLRLLHIQRFQPKRKSKKTRTRSEIFRDELNSDGDSSSSGGVDNERRCAISSRSRRMQRENANLGRTKDFDRMSQTEHNVERHSNSLDIHRSGRPSHEGSDGHPCHTHVSANKRDSKHKRTDAGRQMKRENVDFERRKDGDRMSQTEHNVERRSNGLDIRRSGRPSLESSDGHLFHTQVSTNKSDFKHKSNDAGRQMKRENAGLGRTKDGDRLSQSEHNVGRRSNSLDIRRSGRPSHESSDGRPFHTHVSANKRDSKHKRTDAGRQMKRENADFERRKDGDRLSQSEHNVGRRSNSLDIRRSGRPSLESSDGHPFHTHVSKCKSNDSGRDLSRNRRDKSLDRHSSPLPSYEMNRSGRSNERCNSGDSNHLSSHNHFSNISDLDQKRSKNRKQVAESSKSMTMGERDQKVLNGRCRRGRTNNHKSNSESDNSDRKSERQRDVDVLTKRRHTEFGLKRVSPSQ